MKDLEELYLHIKDQGVFDKDTLTFDEFKVMKNITIHIANTQQATIDYLPPNLRSLEIKVVGQCDVIDVKIDHHDLRYITVTGGLVDILKLSVEDAPRFKMVSTDDNGQIRQIDSGDHCLTDIFVDAPDFRVDPFKYLNLSSLENLGLYALWGTIPFENYTFPRLECLELQLNGTDGIENFKIDAPGLCDVKLSVPALTFDDSFQFEGDLSVTTNEFRIAKWDNLSGLCSLKVRTRGINVTIPDDLHYLQEVDIRAVYGKVVFGDNNEYLTQLRVSGECSVSLPLEAPKLYDLDISGCSIDRLPRFVPELESIEITTDTKELSIDLAPCINLKDIKLMLPEKSSIVLPKTIEELIRLSISTPSTAMSELSIPDSGPNLIEVNIDMPWLRSLMLPEDSINLKSLTVNAPMLRNIGLPLSHRKLETASVPADVICKMWRQPPPFPGAPTRDK